MVVIPPWMNLLSNPKQSTKAHSGEKIYWFLKCHNTFVLISALFLLYMLKQINIGNMLRLFSYEMLIFSLEFLTGFGIIKEAVYFGIPAYYL